MKVIVGSQNPVKVRAVQTAFEKMFPEMTFTFEGCAAASGVSDQPMGMEETLQGALNRAEDCRRAYPDADYFCGLESGIIEESDGSMATTAWVVVMNREGYVGKGMSSLHYIPPQVAALVQQGHELGTADDEVFKQQNSKQGGGNIGILTKGVYTRTDKMVEATYCALVAYRNPDLYLK